MDERYQRQLPLIGTAGQEKLATAKVLVAGCGGLGLPAILALAGAGVGTLVVCDDDLVSESNLNRQLLYTPQDIGRPKLDALQARLVDFRPDLEFVPVSQRLTPGNAAGKMAGCDLVVGAVDNLKTRLVLNDAACRQRLFYVDGAIEGDSGQILAVDPGRTACMACLCGLADGQGREKRLPPVWAPTASTVGSMLAHVALGRLTSRLVPGGGYWLYDGRRMLLQPQPLQKDPDCPTCGQIVVGG